MPLYLASYVGDGTRDSPYRPEGVAAGQAFASIDLRPTWQRCLVWTAGALTGPSKIADTWDEVLRTAVRNAIEQRIGVVLPAGTTARQFVRQVVLPFVRADRDGKRRIYLGSLVHED